MKTNFPEARFRNFFLKNSQKSSLGWPDNSPDCNPIENLWAYMESVLYDNGNFNNCEELTAKLREVWENIPVAVLNSLARSMKKRLGYVLEKPDKKAPY